MTSDLRRPVSRSEADEARGPRSRASAVGLGAAALAVFVTCLGVAAGTAPLATADETGHLDYAYEVWHGHLPEFFRGVVLHLPAGVPVPPVQWESQHPPLFYLLVSPVAGLLAARHYVLADMGVRAVNAVICVITVLAVAWAAGLLNAGRHRSWRVTVAAVAGTIGPLIFTGGSAYGDPLNALWCALGLGVALLVLRRGPSKRRVLAAAAVAAAGAATNAEFVLPFVLLAAALAVAVLLHDRSVLRQRLMRAAAAAAVPVVGALAASGWFYLHNKHVSGNFEGGQTLWAEQHLHSHRQSFSAIVHNSQVQSTQFSLLRHPLDGRTHVFDTRYSVDDHVGIWLLGVTVGLGVLVGVVASVRALRRRDWPELACFAVLVGAVVLDLGYEVSYAMSGGGAVSRYILPALLPVTVLIAAGLRSVGRRLRAAALAVYLGLCYALFSAWLLLETAHPGGKTASKVPWSLVVLVPVALAVLLVVQVACAAALDRTPRAPDAAPAAAV